MELNNQLAISPDTNNSLIPQRRRKKPANNTPMPAKKASRNKNTDKSDILSVLEFTGDDNVVESDESFVLQDFPSPIIAKQFKECINLNDTILDDKENEDVLTSLKRKRRRVSHLDVTPQKEVPRVKDQVTSSEDHLPLNKSIAVKKLTTKYINNNLDTISEKSGSVNAHFGNKENSSVSISSQSSMEFFDMTTLDLEDLENKRLVDSIKTDLSTKVIDLKRANEKNDTSSTSSKKSKLQSHFVSTIGMTVDNISINTVEKPLVGSDNRPLDDVSFDREEKDDEIDLDGSSESSVKQNSVSHVSYLKDDSFIGIDMNSTNVNDINESNSLFAESRINQSQIFPTKKGNTDDSSEELECGYHLDNGNEQSLSLFNKSIFISTKESPEDKMKTNRNSLPSFLDRSNSVKSFSKNDLDFSEIKNDIDRPLFSPDNCLLKTCAIPNPPSYNSSTDEIFDDNSLNVSHIVDDRKSNPIDARTRFNDISFIAGNENRYLDDISWNQELVNMDSTAPNVPHRNQNPGSDTAVISQKSYSIENQDSLSLFLDRSKADNSFIKNDCDFQVNQNERDRFLFSCTNSSLNTSAISMIVGNKPTTSKIVNDINHITLDRNSNPIDTRTRFNDISFITGNDSRYLEDISNDWNKETGNIKSTAIDIPKENQNIISETSVFKSSTVSESGKKISKNSFKLSREEVLRSDLDNSESRYSKNSDSFFDMDESVGLEIISKKDIHGSNSSVKESTNKDVLIENNFDSKDNNDVDRLKTLHRYTTENIFSTDDESIYIDENESSEPRQTVHSPIAIASNIIMASDCNIKSSEINPITLNHNNESSVSFLKDDSFIGITMNSTNLNDLDESKSLFDDEKFYQSVRSTKDSLIEKLEAGSLDEDLENKSVEENCVDDSDGGVIINEPVSSTTDFRMQISNISFINPSDEVHFYDSSIELEQKNYDCPSNLYIDNDEENFNKPCLNDSIKIDTYCLDYNVNDPDFYKLNECEQCNRNDIAKVMRPDFYKLDECEQCNRNDIVKVMRPDFYKLDECEQCNKDDIEKVRISDKKKIDKIIGENFFSSFDKEKNCFSTNQREKLDILNKDSFDKDNSSLSIPMNSEDKNMWEDSLFNNSKERLNSFSLEFGIKSSNDESFKRLNNIEEINEEKTDDSLFDLENRSLDFSFGSFVRNEPGNSALFTEESLNRDVPGINIYNNIEFKEERGNVMKHKSDNSLSFGLLKNISVSNGKKIDEPIKDNSSLNFDCNTSENRDIFNEKSLSLDFPGSSVYNKMEVELEQISCLPLSFTNISTHDKVPVDSDVMLRSSGDNDNSLLMDENLDFDACVSFNDTICGNDLNEGFSERFDVKENKKLSKSKARIRDPSIYDLSSNISEITKNSTPRNNPDAINDVKLSDTRMEQELKYPNDDLTKTSSLSVLNDLGTFVKDNVESSIFDFSNYKQITGVMDNTFDPNYKQKFTESPSIELARESTSLLQITPFSDFTLYAENSLNTQSSIFKENSFSDSLLGDLNRSVINETPFSRSKIRLPKNSANFPLPSSFSGSNKFETPKNTYDIVSSNTYKFSKNKNLETPISKFPTSNLFSSVVKHSLPRNKINFSEPNILAKELKPCSVDMDEINDICLSLNHFVKANEHLLDNTDFQLHSVTPPMTREPPTVHPDLARLFVQYIGNPRLKLLADTRNILNEVLASYKSKLDHANMKRGVILSKCVFCSNLLMCGHYNQLKHHKESLITDAQGEYRRVMAHFHAMNRAISSVGHIRIKRELNRIISEMKKIIQQRKDTKEKSTTDHQLDILRKDLKRSKTLNSNYKTFKNLDEKLMKVNLFNKTREEKMEEYWRFMINNKIKPLREEIVSYTKTDYFLMGSRVTIKAQIKRENADQFLESAVVIVDGTLTKLKKNLERYYHNIINEHLINRPIHIAKEMFVDCQIPLLLLLGDLNLCARCTPLVMSWHPEQPFLMKAQIAKCGNMLLRFAITINLNPISTYQHRPFQYDLQIEHGNVDVDSIKLAIDSTRNGVNKLFQMFLNIFNNIDSIVNE